MCEISGYQNGERYGSGLLRCDARVIYFSVFRENCWECGGV